ncbi:MULTISPECIES: DoxX family protein [unclassified Robiginitalea]|uniref:DoxX family protein n=1 Tax=Robiginitalea TaxID=252306 RepID=UPI00234BBF99|nr:MULTISPECIES: DoxX family protein [unclassified Robiginitalea]MDC6353289.1 DoxX family protein [Robiginitalea sp. PM2]MDC6373545.1 DoxX family protein [Robiginitalea sp. SP8]
MEYLLIGIKIVLFVSIVNVWFFRFNKSTSWRGEGASSMKEEFANYGLTGGLVYVVGAIKVLAATGLLLSIWYPALTLPAATVMAVMMAGAVAMHLKVQDPIRRSFPALLFLVLSGFLIASALDLIAVG